MQQTCSDCLLTHLLCQQFHDEKLTSRPVSSAFRDLLPHDLAADVRRVMSSKGRATPVSATPLGQVQQFPSQPSSASSSVALSPQGSAKTLVSQRRCARQKCGQNFDRPGVRHSLH